MGRGNGGLIKLVGCIEGGWRMEKERKGMRQLQRGEESLPQVMEKNARKESHNAVEKRKKK